MSMEDHVEKAKLDTAAALLIEHVRDLTEKVGALTAQSKSLEDTVSLRLTTLESSCTKRIETCSAHMQKQDGEIKELEKAKSYENGVRDVKQLKAAVEPHWAKVNSGQIAILISVLTLAVMIWSKAH